MASDLISIKEVMELLGLKYQAAVHSWLAKHEVAKEKKEGGRVYVRKSDVLRAMEKDSGSSPKAKSDSAEPKAPTKASAAERPDDPDLISVKEAMELTGHKHQASINQWLDKYGLKQKIGSRVWVSRAGVIAAKDGDVVAKPKEKVEKVEDNPFRKFESKPELIAWNKGLYRGWAVAAVADVSPSTVTLLTDYGKTYAWPHKSVATSIAKGEFFYVKPDEVLKFVALQLLRVKESHEDLPALIREITALTERLSAIKMDLTKVNSEERRNVEDDIDGVESESESESEGDSDSGS